MFNDQLPILFSEVFTSLSREGVIEFANQLNNLEVLSCEPFASDYSAFTILVNTSKTEKLDDSFQTGEQEYTVMIAYSENTVVIGIDVIGCENTLLQEQLVACCS